MKTYLMLALIITSCQSALAMNQNSNSGASDIVQDSTVYNFEKDRGHQKCIGWNLHSAFGKQICYAAILQGKDQDCIVISEETDKSTYSKLQYDRNLKKWQKTPIASVNGSVHELTLGHNVSSSNFKLCDKDTYDVVRVYATCIQILQIFR